ncbi:MAG: exo-alpha-sialidase [Gemmatimonadetes bacterium]|nr:exo-alpha-sialidase [Gemmatimonadota bacterium]
MAREERSRHSALLRRALLALVLSGITVACAGGAADQVASSLTPPVDNSEIDEAELPGAALVAPTLITTPTYEGSGELVHPDAVVFPERWQGRRYWVSGTPYPIGNPKYENPSIYEGYRASQMLVPEGAKNPLAQPGALGGYLSDPDMLYDPVRNQLRMYYRQTTLTADLLYLITSDNGTEWSAPQRVFTGERYGVISPAIVRESATSWRMWSVNAVAQGCYSLGAEISLEQRRSSDGMTWSEPEPVTLNIPRRVPWHLDVQYIPAKQEYWALVAAYPEGTTCSQTSIYFARSADGTNWTASPNPLLGPYEFAPLNDLVYRSTFHYHEASDAVTVWFSGARLGDGGFHFATASARYPYADLVRRVTGASPAMIERERAGLLSVQLMAARTEFEHAFP